jgi:anti-anti-sigma regulatory factor
LVDPLALGVLLSARLRSTRRRGRFVVCCPAGAVRDLFEELGLDTTFELVDHIDLLDDTGNLDVLDDTALLDDTDDRPR